MRKKADDGEIDRVKVVFSSRVRLYLIDSSSSVMFFHLVGFKSLISSFDDVRNAFFLVLAIGSFDVLSITPRHLFWKSFVILLLLYSTII